jgi:hypothetical protein
VRAQLLGGISKECVYVVESSEYIRKWGVWPNQDSGKREVKIEDVIEIQESPCRLPARFAQSLYAAGESGMGYLVFGIRYRDGSFSYHIAGNAVDFVNIPAGKTIDEIESVVPHAGRDQQDLFRAPNYAWCLHSMPISRSNHVPDPTFASGTSPAGQEPGHR